jgi:hypothetical protein
VPAYIAISEARIRVALLRSGGHIAEAARQLGISPRTLSRRLQTLGRADPPDPAEVEWVRMIAMVKEAMLKKAVAGHGPTQRWILKTYCPDSWAPQAPTPRLMSKDEAREFLARLLALSRDRRGS